MTGNTSATGGYLAPLSPPPAQGDDVDDIITEMVAGISGIDGTLVRPRWQPNDPHQPGRDVTWCAVGVTGIAPDVLPYVGHQSERAFDGLFYENVGHDEMQRHEVLTILASFYGPLAHVSASVFRDGLAIEQNRTTMTLAGFGFVSIDNVTAAADLDNQGWIRRIDVAFRLRRIVVRTYPVLNVISASGTLRSELADTDRPEALPAPPTSQTPFSVES